MWFHSYVCWFVRSLHHVCLCELCRINDEHRRNSVSQPVWNAVVRCIRSLTPHALREADFANWCSDLLIERRTYINVGLCLIDRSRINAYKLTTGVVKPTASRPPPVIVITKPFSARAKQSVGGVCVCVFVCVKNIRQVQCTMAGCQTTFTPILLTPLTYLLFAKNRRNYT